MPVLEMIGSGRTYVALKQPAVATAAGRARELAAEALGAWRVGDERAYEILLCLSELVANAVLHGARELALTVELRGGLIEIAVHDDAGGRPEIRALADTAEGGRGLPIVDALAKEWGHRPGAHGKAVWARFTAHD
ncbi:ATP-binding protein [Actinomadura parmotrematis]|uniref:ATP-binding protein n=1 Tax=Actinomadura parmotrematis TaxID=2864039 RepID=A0ABS7FS67_9ACTN|nr:ATP-binding protein [Actinomadura parmotrematis]MBW8483055.1 ATP-binding protein [Actinomadura parmotrematis]